MTEARSRSILKRLSNISKERGVVYKNILTEFLIERMIVKLMSSSNLSNAFIFKGGYVGRRAYGSPRYTIDLDALLRKGNPNSLDKDLISTLEADSEDVTWYRFESKIDLTTQGEYPGIRYAFRAGVGAPLPDIRRAQILNFDIGVGDAVNPVESEMQTLLDRESVSWLVYPRETIIAEKLHSFLSRPVDNSRSKDLFDLQFHLPKADSSGVRDATQKTFKARGDELPADLALTFSKLRTDTLQRGWSSAVVGLADVSSFDDTLQEVLTELRRIFS